MINFKKGTGLTLVQNDRVGAAKTGEGVVAGMLVHVDASGDVIKGVTSQGVDNELAFAINNQADGDVVSSGKIGLFIVDNGAIVETDQVTATINYTNFPVGTRVAGDTTTGKLKAWASGDRVVGYVDSIRTLEFDWTTSTTVLAVALA